MNNFVDLYTGEEVTLNMPGILGRSVVLVYSIVCYSVGMAGLCWLILAMGGLLPYGFGPIETMSPVSAILVNIALVTLFGFQHSIMSRKPFKEKLVRIIPAAAERSTFVLVSGLVMGLAVWCWQPLPGVVWSVESTALKVLLYILFAAGWGYLVLSTFVTNHFELFGLRQAYLYFRGIPHTPVNFVNKYMYTYSRHPMMLGILVGMWSIPEMSYAHFFLSALLSVYIFVGVYFEEQDLVREFGETYRQYRKEIGVFLTIR